MNHHPHHHHPPSAIFFQEVSSLLLSQNAQVYQKPQKNFGLLTLVAVLLRPKPQL